MIQDIFPHVYHNAYAPRPAVEDDHLIVLTEKAHSLEADYRAVSEQMGKLYYKGFSTSEIEQFEAFLERIRDNLEEAL